MTDTADTLEEIRERKRRELQGGQDGSSGDTGSSTEAPDQPVHIEDAEHFSDVVEEYDVVLTDFHAEWCGPCKMLEPIVEELAAETDAAMAKVDVDQLQNLARNYRVQGVPTMILFADGEVAERIVGVREKHDLKNLIERHGTA
ncbi:MAG: thioredoxin [Halodesulfurarchaeum sp.]